MGHSGDTSSGVAPLRLSPVREGERPGIHHGLRGSHGWRESGCIRAIRVTRGHHSGCCPAPCESGVAPEEEREKSGESASQIGGLDCYEGRGRVRTAGDGAGRRGRMTGADGPDASSGWGRSCAVDECPAGQPVRPVRQRTQPGATVPHVRRVAGSRHTMPPSSGDGCGIVDRMWPIMVLYYRLSADCARPGPGAPGAPGAPVRRSGLRVPRSGAGGRMM